MKINAIISSLIICVLSLLLMFQCEKTKEIKIKNSNAKNDIIIKTDTLYKAGKLDTIYYPKIKIITKVLKPTINEIEIINNDTVNLFTTVYSDSVLDARIICKVKGELLNTKITYVKKFPKFIYKTDTVIVNNEKTIIKKKFKIYVGAILGGNENVFLIQPSVILKTKKDVQISFGYELINKTYNIGLFKKITNPFKK